MAGERLQRSVKRLKSITGAGGEFSQLEKQFDKLEDLAAQAGKIHNVVTKNLKPLLVSMLETNYLKTDLKTVSGDLHKACVDSAYITATQKGIKVALGAGFERHVYIRSSVFKKYRGLYVLDGGQMELLQAEYIRLWQIEVDKFLKGGK